MASINQRLAKALSKVGTEHGLEFVEVPIADLPLCSYDYDKDFPPVATAFRYAPNLISDDFELADAGTRDFLGNFHGELQQFVTRVLTVLPRAP
jgi:hypothetical protein